VTFAARGFAEESVMCRDKAPRSDTAVLTAPPLNEALHEHAFLRCTHFFLYTFYMKLLIDHVNPGLPTPLHAAAGVEVKATDQIDDGFRATDPAYDGFDNKDASMIFKQCTAFQRIDAAHFCNLGLKPAFVSALLGRFGTDRLVLDLLERLKIICGNTRWLPQRVNIGPDRIIDVMHGRLALAMLPDATKKIVSGDNAKTYITEAFKEITAYRDAQAKKGNLGVAACAQCYLDAYSSPNFLASLESVMRGEVVGYCTGIGANATVYM
jgi:hypothetical protein